MDFETFYGKPRDPTREDDERRANATMGPHRFVVPTASRDEATDHVRELLIRHGEAPIQRTPPWYEARKNCLTASNVAKVIGQDQYTSAEKYFKQCAGIEQREEISDYVQAMLDFGTVHEDLVARDFCLRHETSLFEFGLCRHPTIPWLAGSPDGITPEGILIEIKCPVKRRFVTGEVPAHYMPQVQILLEIFNLEEAYYVEWKRDVATGKETTNEVKVLRDRAWFERMLPIMEKFWKRVTEHREANDEGAGADENEQ